jgi:hypothetical protein
LSFAGRRLRVNAAVAPAGEIRVAVLDPDGKPVAGPTHERCSPITGDATSTQVTWGSNSDLAGARDALEHVRLAFTLQRAALYSFWIE